jgi:hypothetical protein
MLTFDDKGGGGVRKPPKPAYVIHGLSLKEPRIQNSTTNVVLSHFARTYLQPHYGNGVFGNVYLSAGQH